MSGTAKQTPVFEVVNATQENVPNIFIDENGAVRFYYGEVKERCAAFEPSAFLGMMAEYNLAVLEKRRLHFQFAHWMQDTTKRDWLVRINGNRDMFVLISGHSRIHVRIWRVKKVAYWISKI